MLQSLPGPTPACGPGRGSISSHYRFQDFLRQGQDMSFSRRNTLVLTWVMVLSAQGQAAEFSQVRPDADALMQLPVTEWLTNCLL